MKTQLTILANPSRTYAMTDRMAGRQPVLALLMRLFWAAVLVLPVYGAQAGVVLTSLYSFGSVQDTNGIPLDGYYPSAALVQGGDGSFYGTTRLGGIADLGTVFKINTNGALTSLYSFGGNDGAIPNAALVQGSDGSLFGTTYGGGMDNDYGTVFNISTNGALTTLYSFIGGNDDAHPSAALVQGSDGYFYGTTSGHAHYDYGTVFKINTNGVFTSLYSFMSGNDGAFPGAALVQGADGSLYGTTYANEWMWHFGFWYRGGAGTVFKMSTDGALTTLYAFGSLTNASGVPLDGGNPQAGLVQGSDGSFYGTTSGGGTNGRGTVFKISTNGVLATLYSFGSVQDTNGLALDGANPQAGLVQGSDGSLCGTTSTGGTNGAGTVFKISTNGVLATLYSFGSVQDTNGVALDGASPNGLVQGRDDSFYGTTRCGGTYGPDYGGYGTVFRLTVVPEPPQLTIIPSVASVILTWPTSATGFTLQSTTNLGSSAAWATNSAAPVVVNGQYAVTNPITGTQKFFRLSQ
jgi:uncharacterized repeat protein (TIGR03803 family)